MRCCCLGLRGPRPLHARRIDQDLGAGRIPVAVRFDGVEMEAPYDRDAILIEELDGGSLVKGAVDFGHFELGPDGPSFEGRGRGEVTNFVANGGNVGKTKLSRSASDVSEMHG